MLDTLKICLSCGTKLPSNEFPLKSPKTDYRHPHCPPCWKKVQQAHYQKHKALGSHQKSRYKIHYGITMKQYQDMHDKQEGLCAICSEPQLLNRLLCVDHDHATGKVRGLLCTPCNLALGYVKDKPTVLKAAIEYLEETL